MTSEIDNNDITTINLNNKHIIRDEVKKLFMNDINLSELEATDLEIGIFNTSIDYANYLKIGKSWSSHLFMETYINYARSFYANLKKDSYIKNEKLIERFRNREFLPHELPYKSCEEVFPERWKDIIEKQKLKFKAAYEIKQVAMTDSIKCSKCKNNKISYYELQTRSGDEAMTVYFSCIVCSHRWRN